MTNTPTSRFHLQITNTPSRKAMLDEFVENMRGLGREVIILAEQGDEVLVHFARRCPSPEELLLKAAYGSRGSRGTVRHHRA